MRFSARSKVGIILSFVTILTVVSGFLVMAVSSRGTASQAASKGGKTYHHGAIHKIARGALAHSIPKGPGTHLTRQQAFHIPVAKHAVPLDGAPAKGITAKALKGHAPAATDSLGTLSARAAEGDVLQNFEGLSDLDSAAVNGFSLTPPDQGLCTGIDGTVPGEPQVVFEIVNLVVRETDTTGVPL